MVASRAILRFAAPPSATVLSETRSETNATRLALIGHSGGWYVLDSSSQSAAQLVTTLGADPNVLQVAPDVVGYAPGFKKPEAKARRPFTDNTPNDPDFPSQWGLQNTGQTVNGIEGVAGNDVNAVGAWNTHCPGDVGYVTSTLHCTSDPGSTNIAIADIDTGIDYSISDLSDNMWSAPSAYQINIQGNIYDCTEGSHGFSAVDYDAGCSGQEADISGHGTAVASIAGAQGNNDTEIAGTAWSTEMLSLRVFNSSGETCETTVQTAYDALTQITQQFGSQAPVGVVNLEVAFEDATPGLESSIATAAAAGIVTVAATGDTCQSTAEYPAYYRTTGETAVSAFDQLGDVAYWGAGVCTNPGGQVAAPGKNIGTLTMTDGQDSFGFNGTSAAVPFVGAAAAMLMSVCPLTPNGVVNTIAGTASLNDNLTSISDGGQVLNMGQMMASCIDTINAGSGSVGVSMRQGQGLFDTYGTATVTLDGTSYNYSYDSFDDDAESIAEGLAGQISGRYFSAGTDGNGNITITSNAAGSFTNYTLATGVTHSCDGPVRECDPAPTMSASGSTLTGGSGPTRPE